MLPYYSPFDTTYKAEFCGRSATGLYPHEILLLFYINSGSLKKPYAKFWGSSYGVADVDALVASLASRGYVNDGILTEKGRTEIATHEWVLKAHRGKNYGISLCAMSRLVSQNPGSLPEQVAYSELERRANLYSSSDPTMYTAIKEQMAEFFEDEKRYDCAIWAISEVIYYDVNILSSQDSIDRKTLIDRSHTEKLNNYLFAEGMSHEDYVQEFIRMFNSAPKQGRVLPLSEIASLIIAYIEGNTSMIDSIYRSAKRVGTAEYSSDYDGTLNISGVYNVPPRPKNNAIVHAILFLLTCGLGNIVYWLYINSKQKEWDRKYS